ncbi:hypothetical protein BN2476_380111 [Paraburkholderia piptadeniae]|uniref:Uncharacterized protein n=1 Tax=Paraburkholderia piptadeniae TaxID=1701573 RepID=A0A1N7SB87_9BURK|nr:hypothetical protein BN2476_380111 [Paraburkholderia piptadeniae]
MEGTRGVTIVAPRARHLMHRMCLTHPVLQYKLTNAGGWTR